MSPLPHICRIQSPRHAPHGHRHPLSIMTELATDVFVDMGYTLVDGVEDAPEIENDYYCFEALNCPKDHPARDMQVRRATAAVYGNVYHAPPDQFQCRSSRRPSVECTRASEASMETSRRDPGAEIRDVRCLCPPYHRSSSHQLCYTLSHTVVIARPRYWVITPTYTLEAA